MEEFGKLMFGDWDDGEWCVFDNYMIKCLQLYLREGLMKCESINMLIKNLAAATGNEYVEWCGLYRGAEPNINLGVNRKVYGHVLYSDFTHLFSDYARGGSAYCSQISFYKWLDLYAHFKYGISPISDRDSVGRWFIFRNEPDEDKIAKENQSKIEF